MLPGFDGGGWEEKKLLPQNDFAVGQGLGHVQEFSPVLLLMAEGALWQT